MCIGVEGRMAKFLRAVAETGMSTKLGVGTKVMMGKATSAGSKKKMIDVVSIDFEENARNFISVRIGQRLQSLGQIWAGKANCKMTFDLDLETPTVDAEHI